MQVLHQLKAFIKKIIPDFLIDKYHLTLSFLGVLFYWFPSKKMTVIGVTGTKGKSTTVKLISKILEEAGYKVVSSSSIEFQIADKKWQNKLKMGMPGRWKLQKLLRQGLRAGCRYAVIEITSEGIAQHRQKFIDFAFAVFTNLAPEHIEAHGSFEQYRAAKKKFFEQVKKIHIVNLDDGNVEYFLKIPSEKKWGYGLKIYKPVASLLVIPLELSNQFSKPNFQTLIAQHPQVLKNGIKFSINNTEFNLNLLGKFNIYNALTAICVGLSQGIGLKTCKTALEKVKRVEGRMEKVIKEPFTVIVDYAHTPDSLEQVYQNVLSFRSYASRLICVLGSCGGGRDKWKRPVLGKIAAKYCDEVIITNEDPYDEDPMEIINQVAKGAEKKASVGGHRMSKPDRVLKILDRQKAIRKALNLAKSGDTVIITGKGCEPWLCLFGGKKIPWDDRRVVKEEYKKLTKFTKSN